jgi:hypothetical protein
MYDIGLLHSMHERSSATVMASDVKKIQKLLILDPNMDVIFQK